MLTIGPYIKLTWDNICVVQETGRKEVKDDGFPDGSTLYTGKFRLLLEGILNSEASFFEAVQDMISYYCFKLNLSLTTEKHKFKNLSIGYRLVAAILRQ